MDLRKTRLVGVLMVGTLAGGSLCGCSHMNYTERGALVGSGLGAATGAVLGSAAGSAGKGALIGAAAGALGGALVGNAEQNAVERDAALAYARDVEYSRAVDQHALSNSDIIVMSQNGVPQNVIINAITTRGGRFDTSPAALIALKQSGVGDAVIQTMQTAGPPVVAATPVVVAPPPPQPEVIFVEPLPPPPAVIIERPCPPPRWRPHRRRGSHIHIGATF